MSPLPGPPLQTDGFYYWPDALERDDVFIPVIRFLRIEDHARARTAPKTYEMPGAYATVELALRQARAELHLYAVPGLLIFLWAIQP